MNVAIVTFVRAYNYGAVLQCYALCKTLQKLGIDTEVIDYYPKYFRDKYTLAYLSGIRYLPYRPLKNWLKFIPVLSTIEKRCGAFDKFIRNNIPVTKKQYCTFEEMNQEQFQYDLFVSGSDQVWSDTCADFDPIFFLQFESAERSKRASYAASFGFSKIPEDKKDEYKKRLANWNAYSVRENAGVSILNDLLDINAVRSCDPTLLLTKSDWDRIKSQKCISKPYILIYSVDSGKKQLLEYAKELSKQKNMMVVNLPCSIKYEGMMGYDAKEYGFDTVGAAGPREWLSLFSNASYVLTDSFHGTVFSILNHKQFLTMVDFLWGENNRVKELLKILGLENRTINMDIDAIVDWDRVDSMIESMRNESIAYLDKLKYVVE